MRFLVALLLPALAAFASAQPLHVLWIISDDLGPELGCYGNPDVKTPRIDALAAEGRRFENAFTTSPVCSSSRTAFITGKYQTTINGHHHNTRDKQPLPERASTAMELFSRAGYATTNGSMKGEVPLGSPGKTHYNFIFDAKTAFDGYDWREIADKSQPLFAQVQIGEPHRSFKITGRSGADLKIPPFYPDHPVTRADYANYLAMVEEVDRKVGVVLDRLKEDGLYEKTAIFFFGDHGAPHVRGKQWLYDEGIHIPLIVRVPGEEAGAVDERLISAIDILPTSLALAGIEPRSSMHGSNWRREGSKGREAVFAARDRCGDAPDRIRAVRTQDWKYIRNFEPERSYSQHSGYKKAGYPVLTLMAVMHRQGRLKGPAAEWFAETRPAEELYDLRSDPDEISNLAADPAHEEQLQKMRGMLEDWIGSFGDQGELDESEVVDLPRVMEEKWKSFDRTMKKRGLSAEVSDEEYLRWWKKELGVE